MKIQSLLIAVSAVCMSLPGSAMEGLNTDVEKRLDDNPVLACSMSYDLMVKVLGNQSQQNKPEGYPEILLAPQEVYMRDCLSMPRMVQKCLVDQYAFHHMDACQQARQEFETSGDKY